MDRPICCITHELFLSEIIADNRIIVFIFASEQQEISN